MSEDAATISISGLARLRPACGRADQTFAARIGADGGGKNAGDRGDRAVEAKLAQHREARQRVVRDGADRRHQPERDGEIVVAPFLGQVGGREIDGDAPRRQRQPGRDHGRAHALARFRYRLVWEPDDRERGHPRERHRGDALDHVRPCPRRTVAEVRDACKNI
jgi:hypothetical protein